MRVQRWQLVQFIAMRRWGNSWRRGLSSNAFTLSGSLQFVSRTVCSHQDFPVSESISELIEAFKLCCPRFWSTANGSVLSTFRRWCQGRGQDLFFIGRTGPFLSFFSLPPHPLSFPFTHFPFPSPFHPRPKNWPPLPPTPHLPSPS